LIDFAHFNELNLIAKKVTPPPNLQKKTLSHISELYKLSLSYYRRILPNCNEPNLPGISTVANCIPYLRIPLKPWRNLSAEKSSTSNQPYKKKKENQTLPLTSMNAAEFSKTQAAHQVKTNIITYIKRAQSVWSPHSKAYIEPPFAPPPLAECPWFVTHFRVSLV